jgi:hypothetical protein
MRKSITRVLAGVLVAPMTGVAQVPSPVAADTTWIEVGSPRVDGRVYQPHAARVRVRIGDSPRVTSEWTNELTIGDSAGRQVMRWVTRGQQFPASGATGPSYVLSQTYDARTLSPLGYHSVWTSGQFTQVTIDGKRMRGVRRTAADTTLRPLDVTFDRPGFFAGASDLVPLAVGFEPGAVIVAPLWNPNWTQTIQVVFTVVGKETITVEGTRLEAWKITEHGYADRKLRATWWLLDRSPYMVYGEVPLANGSIQKMTEVEIPPRQ